MSKENRDSLTVEEIRDFEERYRLNIEDLYDYSVCDEKGRFKLNREIFMGDIFFVEGDEYVMSIGYEFYDNLGKKSIYVERNEAIEMVKKEKIQNAYVILDRVIRNVDEKADKYPVLEIDDSGSVKKPVNILIDKGDCTDRMVKVIKEVLKREGVEGW